MPHDIQYTAAAFRQLQDLPVSQLGGMASRVPERPDAVIAESPRTGTAARGEDHPSSANQFEDGSVWTFDADQEALTVVDVADGFPRAEGRHPDVLPAVAGPACGEAGGVEAGGWSCRGRAVSGSMGAGE